MRLLLTRPEADSAALAQVLRSMGHETVSAPLLTIRFIDDAEIPVRAWQALLVTSANGARALGYHPAAALLKGVAVLAVGEASAETAAEQGFTNVRAAGGDVDTLVALAVTELDPAKGPLLHAAGSTVAGDLVSLLGSRGFDTVRAVLYEAEKAERLPGDVLTELERGTLDGVLFYSPRTARHFVQLVMKAGLEQRLETATAYCLSPAVAAALDGLEFGILKIAPEPSQKALLALISA
ncbi:uroporphyrinogen-III synthase [Parvibaculum sp.]|uniref:uroporphyrinogen-III synthase n=1 Tax=Parvibaculum sp. TaxID=2024848 RepID=UPI001B19197D|nr:uroporphyrinogen-III synthase [Parvibaculum sp.]MBO6633035.1 uroporphyrinogen-III synthase [Parvibaculum sp.]MBO6677365.1 uroporphyrinogen-III synthase [Parvibaculum sp.]MBO6685210.1 uroporphyrinogen-III synthase [Parvibaculum sp.]MBO6903994.1 uroporphyrinogen-III synthase [Parvibaculum sp.]